jgi:branched-chain amino acid transport system substrate-binding protein
VALGQIGTFSGVAGQIAAGARAAMALWAKQTNARGGLACHPVQLYSADDAGDPARAASAAKQLIADHHVVAFVGNYVPFSVSGFRSQIEQAKVPAIGEAMLAPDWNASPWMFPQGASLADQVLGIAKAGVAAGHRRFGLIYCVEVPGCGFVEKTMHGGAVKAAGGELLYESPVSLTQPDFTAQCLNAKNAGVDILGLGVDGASMTRIARSCAAIGYRPLLAVGAGTFTLDNTKDPNLRAFGMIGESPVAPWTGDDTPGLRELHSAISQYEPQFVLDGAAMCGWSSGKLIEAAVENLKPAERSGPLTSALTVTGLERIHDQTLGGLTSNLTFTPGQTHADSTGCIYVERLGPDGWTAPYGSSPLCGADAGGAQKPAGATAAAGNISAARLWETR